MEESVCLFDFSSMGEAFEQRGLRFYANRYAFLLEIFKYLFSFLR
jgi:hypothetical protein